MATHSSMLVWEIPRTEEPSRLQSKESQKNWTKHSDETTAVQFINFIKAKIIIKVLCFHIFSLWINIFKKYHFLVSYMFMSRYLYLSLFYILIYFKTQVFCNNFINYYLHLLPFRIVIHVSPNDLEVDGDVICWCLSLLWENYNRDLFHFIQR